MLKHCDTVTILIVKSLSCFDLFELVSTGKKQHFSCLFGRKKLFVDRHY